MDTCETPLPKCVEAADLDADGDVDVVCLDGWWGRMILYVNNGSGGFNPPVVLGQGSFSGAKYFRLVDMDGDADADIVVLSDVVQLYRNLGGGAFSSPQTLGYASTTSAMLVEDLDSDGFPDLSYTDGSFWIWRPNDGNGGLLAPNVISSFSSPSSLSGCDVGNDGDVDLLYTSGPNAYWRENTGGLFGAEIPLGWTISTALESADLDGDGDRDVACRTDTGVIEWRENNGIDLSIVHVVGNTGPTDFLRAADVDGNGTLDLVVADAQAGQVRLWSNTGGAFLPETLLADSCEGVLWAAFGDLGNDGIPDMVTAAYVVSAVEVHEGVGGGVFNAPLRLDFGLLSPRFGQAVDIDADGDLDWVCASLGNGTVAWLPNDGAGLFGPLIVLDISPISCRSLVCGDIEGDGDSDIAIVAETQHMHYRILSYRNDGLGNFALPDTLSTELPYDTRLTSASLNNDGLLDFICSSGDTLLVLVSSGGLYVPGLTAQVALASGTRGEVGDIDMDGDLDLLWSEWGVFGRVEWRANNGAGVFGQAQVLHTTSRIAQLNDVDTDGDIDVAFIGEIGTSNTLALHWYPNDGLGAFPVVANCDSVVGPFQFLNFFDLDQDGDEDVLCATTTAQYWRPKYGPGWFGPAQLLVEAGVQPLPADLDGDGDLDLLGGLDYEPCRLNWFENPGMLDHVQENTASYLLSVVAFPNPFTQHVTVRFQDPDNQVEMILLVDACGLVALQVPASRAGDQVLDLTGLVQGIYSVLVMGSGAVLGYCRVVAQ